MLVRVARGELLAHAIERDVETRVLDRFQEIVERVGFERTQRILIVRGHENRQRHLRRRHGSQKLETVDAGHLHVEEHEIGLVFGNREERLAAVAGLGDDLDIGMACQPERESAPGEGFIVNDQRTRAHRQEWPLHSRSSGRRSVTRVPCGSHVRMVKLWCSP